MRGIYLLFKIFFVSIFFLRETQMSNSIRMTTEYLHFIVYGIMYI